jgi:hypothetical protein
LQIVPAVSGFIICENGRFAVISLARQHALDGQTHGDTMIQCRLLIFHVENVAGIELSVYFPLGKSS